MSKAKTLAGTVSTGGALSNPDAIPVAKVTGLAAVATSGAYSDLSGKPSANSLLPSQTGNSDKFLSTDGTDPVWSAVAINQSTLVADGAITAAGKALVLTAAGKAKQSVIANATYGSNATFLASQTRTSTVLFEPVAGVFVIIYQDTVDSNKGKMKIVTLDASNNATFGSAFTFYNLAIYSGSLNACFDPVTGQILIAFTENVNNYGAVITAKITGSNITFGTAAITGVAGYEVGICYDLSVSKFLLSYRKASVQEVMVGTVSGTSVSFSSATTVYGSSVNGYGSPVIHCQSLSTNVVGWNTGGRGYFAQVKINPSTFAVTVGTQTSYGNPSGADGYLYGDRSLAWVNSLNRLLVIHDGGPTASYALQITMLSPTGVGWNYVTYMGVGVSTEGAPYQYYPSIDWSASAGCAVISFINNVSKTGYIAFSNTLTSTAVAFSTQTQFQSTATDMTCVALSTTNSKAMVVAFDNTNPTPSAALNGTCVAGNAPLFDLRANFIGFSKASAADGANVTFTTTFGVDTNQSGLTPNTTYYLDASNGSTLSTTASGPKVARALSATTVQVLGPNCA